jgi:hypothetical protein
MFFEFVRHLLWKMVCFYSWWLRNGEIDMATEECFLERLTQRSTFYCLKVERCEQFKCLYNNSCMCKYLQYFLMHQLVHTWWITFVHKSCVTSSITLYCIFLWISKALFGNWFIFWVCQYIYLHCDSVKTLAAMIPLSGQASTNCSGSVRAKCMFYMTVPHTIWYFS